MVRKRMRVRAERISKATLLLNANPRASLAPIMTYEFLYDITVVYG